MNYAAALILVDTMSATFSTIATLLDSTKRTLARTQHPNIDADHSDIESLCDSPHARGTFGAYETAESHITVVGQ
ncbi:unnamed protein product [Clonostachys rosea]|uniref:Uncharacterized protein n=1 Tax=Bionectria ochroleuca TaxID=29856 RepID=A0ABY6TQ98_BIOOC|nr:unnamed protein product [Clonostachys rosea]